MAKLIIQSLHTAVALLAPRIMGSYGMFASLPCLQCASGTRPQTYPYGRAWCCMCVGRALKAHRRLVLEPLANSHVARLPRPVTFTLQAMLLDLDVFETDSGGNVRLTRSRRKHFLYCVLLSHGPCFKKIIHVRGEWAGRQHIGTGRHRGPHSSFCIREAAGLSRRCTSGSSAVYELLR